MPITGLVTRRSVSCLSVFLILAVPAFAQSIHSTPGPEARAVRLEAPVRIDGKLDEPVWLSTPPATDFRQAEPHEGQSATQRTEVRFAYDDAYIYVGARMFDDSGAAGVKTRLVRRDADVNSDYVQVIFDTYHDHIGRLFFLVNPSGVKADANGLGGGGDSSWDPVWDVATTIDSLGWTAEMRIPFSQLRYPRTSEPQTWGLQIWRQVHRLNELSQWSFWGLQEAGGPPRFGHLSDLVVTSAPGRVEVWPYVVGRSANGPVTDPSDPFQQPHATDGRVGGDARILLTSNLTLNATVNPDFGQVEVDPAVVNLTAFETFFDEKRPFFVEGAGYFGFGGLNCYFCSNVSSLSTFYTRRVGRAPSMTGNAFQYGDYADVPDNTPIIGAAKLTGRTRSGWSIGLLDAVTARVSAPTFRVDTLLDAGGAITSIDSVSARAVVEPLSNYFVARFAKDLDRGALQIRGIATSVIRDLGSDAFLRARMNSHSELLGVAADWFFRSRTYRLMAQLATSQVSGDSAALRRLQDAPYRLFSRPDRGQGKNGFLTDRYDPTLTSMRGMGGYARFSRETGSLQFEVSTNVRTPGFENNDIAALSSVDYWWSNANIYRQWTRPTSVYRSMWFIVGGQRMQNFDGDRTDQQSQIMYFIQPRNYWQLSAWWIHRFSVLDDRLARGGPVLQRVPNDIASFSLGTDNRKALVFYLNAQANCNAEGYCGRNIGVTADIKPRSNITLSVGPSLARSESGVQYITAVNDTSHNAFYDRRYVFADLTQRSVSMNTRVNISFTTNLTFELFLQPLIASGDYIAFSEFAQPRASRRLQYGRDIGTVTESVVSNPDGSTTKFYLIDPDSSGTTNGPAPQFTIQDPNFTLRSLRGNAVLRWEYRPGSTLFVVWTRDGSSTVNDGTIDFREDARAMVNTPATNIFLIKVNYRIGF